MKYFLIIFLLCGSFSFGAEPCCPNGECPLPAATALVKSSTTASPLDVAVSAVQSSASTLSTKVSERDKLKIQLDGLNVDITTLTATLVSDRATLNQLLDDLSDPNPKPLPVVRVVQLVEIASSSCPPCNQFQPTFDKMVKSGINMRRIDADKEKNPFSQVNSTPSWIMTVGGKEVSKLEGYLGKDKLTEWYNQTLNWAKAQK